MAMSAELRNLRGRIAAQERMSNMLLARVEELSEDMQLSFKQSVEAQVEFERHLDARFEEVKAQMATKEDLASLKKDLASFEVRVFDAFQQLLTVIDTRLPPQP